MPDMSRTQVVESRQSSQSPNNYDAKFISNLLKHMRDNDIPITQILEEEKKHLKRIEREESKMFERDGGTIEDSAKNITPSLLNKTIATQQSTHVSPNEPKSLGVKS